MTSQKVILVLGSGGRVGASVASLFGRNGYSVAIAARSLNDSEVDDNGHLQIRADLAEPNAVGVAFEKARQKFGAPPSVVVYNAAAAHIVPAENPLSVSYADFQQDLVVNTSSALLAAQKAVEGFAQLPDDVKKTYIYTGNVLNSGVVMPPLFSLGTGKSASAHLVHVASAAYAGKGYRFYYADERKGDGSAAFRDVNGPSHAEHYLRLAESEEQLPWLQTFVGGEGYREFGN